jgi:hypothetical protein
LPHAVACGKVKVIRRLLKDEMGSSKLQDEAVLGDHYRFGCDSDFGQDLMEQAVRSTPTILPHLIAWVLSFCSCLINGMLGVRGSLEVKALACAVLSW